MENKLKITRNLMIGLIFLSSVFSCNNAKNGWKKASQENTIMAYEAFLNNYNDSSFMEQAINKIWVLTTKENTIQMYEDFLAKYPESNYTNQALDAIWGITTKENSITAYENFSIKHSNSPLTIMAAEEIKKLFTSFTPLSPIVELNSSLRVDIVFENVAEADSYIIYWSSSKNGALKKANSQSTNSVRFEHWPDSFPMYYRIIAVRGNLMSKPSEASKVELLSSKNGTICQICGDNAIGYCHLREIYVCSTHNTYTSKDGTNWQCP